MFNFNNQNTESQAVFYGRVSSEDQAERGTIQNQIEFSAKYCDLHKINIIEKYLDDGVTGTLPLEDRGDGLKLIEDAKAGKFNLVLIYKLDRLGRTARVILNAIHELEECGVKLRSMTEPFDTGDPSGRFLVTILAGVADLDRSSTLERLWNGANRAAREGKWLGGIVPFGYLKEDAYLVPSAEPMKGFYMSEVEVVRMVYSLVVDQRMSTKKIADYLNSLGVPPSYAKDGRQISKGKRKENTAGIWRPGRIRGMIVNPTYKGIHEYGKRSKKQREIIAREFPPIVDVDIWEQAQVVLHENQIGAMRNAKRKYLLRNLVKCGSCGLNYCGTHYTGPGGLPKGYYTCNGKLAYNGPELGKCKSKNIPQAWVEDLVWSDIIRFVNDPTEVLQILKKTPLLPNLILISSRMKKRLLVKR
jgi:Site-specific recombinases, DNA invertase Pin homologs